MTIQPIAVSLPVDCSIDGTISPDNSQMFEQILQENMPELPGGVPVNGDLSEIDEFAGQDAASSFMAMWMLGGMAAVANDIPDTPADVTPIEEAATPVTDLNADLPDIQNGMNEQKAVDDLNQPGFSLPDAAAVPETELPEQAPQNPLQPNIPQNTAQSEAPPVIEHPVFSGAPSAEADRPAEQPQIENPELAKNGDDITGILAQKLVKALENDEGFNPTAIQDTSGKIQQDQSVVSTVVKNVDEKPVTEIPDSDKKPVQDVQAPVIRPDNTENGAPDSGGMDAGAGTTKSNKADQAAIGKEMTDPAVFNVENPQPSQVSFEDKSEAVAKAVNSIMDDIKTISGREANSIEIQLEPESLGKLAISLVMSEAGLIAQIKSADSEIRSILAGQINQLVETLKSNGVTVQSVEVLSSQVEQQDFTQQNAQQQFQFSRQEARMIRTAAPDIISGYEVMDDQSYQYQTEITHSGSIDYRA